MVYFTYNFGLICYLKYMLWRTNNQTKKLLLQTIPKKFIREHQLNNYYSVVLSFGYVKFLIQLLVRRDPRKADDNTHLIMYSNWQRIMDEAGMSMGKVLRFEMVEEKSVIKYTLKFVDMVFWSSF
ncbi:putative transcription factor B3-Domain family [Helianthus anomalus]